MKKAVLITVTVIMLLLSSIPVFAADYSCSLTVSDTSVKAGEVIKLDLGISSGMTGIDVIISYDAEKFEFIEGKTTTLMTVFSNDAQAGSVHIAGVSTEPTEAGVLYSCQLRVLASGGEIKTHVKEALDGKDNDISSLIKDNTLKIKASGTFHTVPAISGPVPTTSPIVTAEGGKQSAQAENTQAVSTGADKADIDGENEAMTDENGNTVDGDGKTTVILSKDDPESVRGLAVALSVGVLTLGGIVAVLLSKRASKSKKNGESPEEKTDEK